VEGEEKEMEKVKQTNKKRKGKKERQSDNLLICQKYK
jgi:hypothetical protein